jgi:RNA polymerase sigma-70 factor, ECF subfamily
VASILGIREGTVRVRLHRARLFLRKELRRKPGAASPRTAPTGGRSCRGMFASLSDYLDGIVDDAACEQMQKHIADCAPCQAFVESLRRTVEACRAYTPECHRKQAEFQRELLRKYLAAAEALNQRAPRKRAHRA